MIMVPLCIAQAFVFVKFPPRSLVCEGNELELTQAKIGIEIIRYEGAYSKTRLSTGRGSVQCKHKCKYKLSPSHLPVVHPHAPARLSDVTL